jgi:hypothetical protein
MLSILYIYGPWNINGSDELGRIRKVLCQWLKLKIAL